MKILRMTFVLTSFSLVMIAGKLENWKTEKAVAQSQNCTKVSELEELIKLGKEKMPDNVIISVLGKAPLCEPLDAAIVLRLTKAGASPAVLDALSNNAKKKDNDNLPPTQSAANSSKSGSTLSGASLAASDTIILVDEDRRIELMLASAGMKSSNPFNPLGIKAIQTLKGNHAQLRITNISPQFEFGLPSNMNPVDMIQLLKADVKSDRREIQAMKASAFGAKTGANEKAIVPVTFETVSVEDVGGRTFKIYRMKPVQPMPPGEYAVTVNQQSMIFDFGIDAARSR